MAGFIGVLVVGALLGSALTDFLVTIVPEGPNRALLLKEITAGLSPTTLDLKIVVFTLGFMLKLNIMSVAGVLASALIFKAALK